MKKIFLDTNILLDSIIRSSQYPEAEHLLIECKKRQYDLFISYLSVANFAYITRKMGKEMVESLVERVCRSFNIVPNHKNQILANISLHPSDFEDGLQYQAALEAKCDYIISRNEKDYQFSKIPVLTPIDFIHHYL